MFRQPGFIIIAGVVIIVGYMAFEFVHAIWSYSQRDPAAAVSSTQHYLLVRCPDCHSERHPDPGCGELEDEAWVECMESSELIKALHLQHEL